MKIIQTINVYLYSNIYHNTTMILHLNLRRNKSLYS